MAEFQSLSLSLSLAVTHSFHLRLPRAHALARGFLFILASTLADCRVRCCSLRTLLRRSLPLTHSRPPTSTPHSPTQASMWKLPSSRLLWWLAQWSTMNPLPPHRPARVRPLCSFSSLAAPSRCWRRASRIVLDLAVWAGTCAGAKSPLLLPQSNSQSLSSLTPDSSTVNAVARDVSCGLFPGSITGVYTPAAPPPSVSVYVVVVGRLAVVWGETTGSVVPVTKHPSTHSADRMPWNAALLAATSLDENLPVWIFWATFAVQNAWVCVLFARVLTSSETRG